jgi:general secretion pathway protein D
MRLEDIGTIKPQSEVAVIPLEYLNPTEAEPTIRLLMSPTGTVQSVPSSKTVIVIDLPERILKVKEYLRLLEQGAKSVADREQQRQQEAILQQQQAQARTQQPVGPGQSPDAPAGASPTDEIVRVFMLQFVKAGAVVEAVTSAMSGDGRVSALVEENRLVVIGPAAAVTRAESVLQQIDIPRPQVRITAILYDVNLEVMEKFGFNWSHLAKGRINAAGDPQSLMEYNSRMFAPPAPPAASSSSGTAGTTPPGVPADPTAAAEATTTVAPAALGGLMTLSHLSRHFDVNAVIQALDQTDGARLLARPTIMAYDRNPAEIKIVSEIPVQQLTETQQGGNIGTTEFREAGITLTVTPQVLADNTIMLDVAPEFSVLAGYAEGQPIIDRRNTKTKVQMLNGQTLIIGGLLRRNEIETVRGIPGMMHWKYLGFLFRDHDTTVTDSELLVFIKTEVISPACLLPREQAAVMVANERLDEIPHASHEPFIPPCNDPWCPYHNPRGGYSPEGPCTHQSHPNGGDSRGPAQNPAQQPPRDTLVPSQDGQAPSHDLQRLPAEEITPPEASATNPAPNQSSWPDPPPDAPGNSQAPGPARNTDASPRAGADVPAPEPPPQTSGRTANSTRTPVLLLPPAMGDGSTSSPRSAQRPPATPSPSATTPEPYSPPPVIIDQEARRNRSIAPRLAMVRLPRVEGGDSPSQSLQGRLARPSLLATPAPLPSTGPSAASPTFRMTPLPPTDASEGPVMASRPPAQRQAQTPKKIWLENVFSR